MKLRTIVFASILSLQAPAYADNRPWHVRPEGFTAPEPGEHPRLLFRKSDLPALRKKAQTPEGKAILKRLRQLLDGKDGTPQLAKSSVAPSQNTTKKAAARERTLHPTWRSWRAGRGFWDRPSGGIAEPFLAATILVCRSAERPWRCWRFPEKNGSIRNASTGCWPSPKRAWF